MENNKLVKIGEEHGLEENKVQILLKSYGDYFKQAHELVQGAMDINVQNEDDFENMEKARQRRLALRKVRTGVENIRKSLKEQSLREGRAVDGMANIIKALVEPVEEHLMNQEKYAEELAKQRKITIEHERISKLSRFVGNVSDYTLHPDQMGNDVFESLLKNSEIAYKAQKQAAKLVEEQRIAEEAEKLAEDKRIREENEKLRLLQVEKQKQLELESKEKEELARKLQEKEDELARKLKEKEDAAAEEIRKVHELELANKERERQLALAPDKEKILKLADQIANIEMPAVKDEMAMSILVELRCDLINIDTKLRNQVEGLSKNETRR